LPCAVANTVAFDEGQPWLDELLLALRASRGRLDTLLAEHLPPVVRWRPEDVQATYLARLDCPPAGLDDPAGLFERRGRVAFEPGSLLGPTLAVATPHAPLLLLVPAEARRVASHRG
jgi:cysteine-S-conjugate beta-lyase